MTCRYSLRRSAIVSALRSDEFAKVLRIEDGSRTTGCDRFCLQGLPPRVKIEIRFFYTRRYWVRTYGWTCWHSHLTFLKFVAAAASKQYQEQTASLQTAFLPKTYRASQDMSRAGELYLKTGEQKWSIEPHEVLNWLRVFSVGRSLDGAEKGTFTPRR